MNLAALVVAVVVVVAWVVALVVVVAWVVGLAVVVVLGLVVVFNLAA